MLSIPFYSQVQITNSPSNLTLTNFKFSKSKFDFNLSFSQMALHTDSDFSIYNKNTMLNESFSFSNSEYTLKKPELISINQLGGTKIDTFNPNGVDNIYMGLFLGTINFVTDLFKSK